MATMKKWEYFTYDQQIDNNQMNTLGSKGWELVSHSAVTDGHKVVQYYVFKREIIKQ